MGMIHRASSEEQLAAYRNVHEVWGGDMALEAYVQWRLNSRQHNRACCWVSTLRDGSVAASLAVYPLQFREAEGGIVPGIGIGAVHTRPDQRRRGRAEALCREVLRRSTGEAVRRALLFSDIAPEYYAGMGFALVGTQRWRCDGPDALDALAEGADASLLTAIESPAERMDLLAGSYQAQHAGRCLHLHRDPDYWDYSLDKNCGERFVEIGDGEGYALIFEDTPQGVLYPVELALRSPDDGRLPEVWRALAMRARSLGMTSLSSWLAPPPALSRRFVRGPLDKAIPMIADLATAGSPGVRGARACAFYSSDHF